MKKRVTLTLEPAITHKAKRLAKLRDTSVSALVESLLTREADGVSLEGAQVFQGMFSQRWAGKLELKANDDARLLALKEKYQL